MPESRSDTAAVLLDPFALGEGVDHGGIDVGVGVEVEGPQGLLAGELGGLDPAFGQRRRARSSHSASNSSARNPRSRNICSPCPVGVVGEGVADGGAFAASGTLGRSRPPLLLRSFHGGGHGAAPSFGVSHRLANSWSYFSTLGGGRVSAGMWARSGAQSAITQQGSRLLRVPCRRSSRTGGPLSCRRLRHLLCRCTCALADSVRGERACTQRRRESGDDVVVWKVPVRSGPQ